MEDEITSVIEYYVYHNLPKKYDLDKITNLYSDLLDDGDKVLYYIPGNKMTSIIIFTRKKVIIGQRFSEWGGDIFLPYENIHELEIQPQNKLFFIQLDLIVKFRGITIYIKKSEAYNFKKLMWDIFEIR